MTGFDKGTSLVIGSREVWVSDLPDASAGFLERLELVSGPRAFLYGLNGAGGVVNLVTRNYNSNRPYTRLSYSEDPDGFSHSDGTFAQNITRRLNVTAGFQFLGTDGSRFRNSLHEQWNIRGKLRFGLSERLTLTLSEYIRIQNLANEAFGSTGLWAGFGPRFLKPIGINETKEMLIEKYQRVPVRKTYTADPQQFGYLDRPQNKLLIPMHYVLKNDKASQLGRAPLQYGKVRIFQEDRHGGTAFLGEDWGKFTPLDDEMRLYVGTAQDVVVKRTIDRNEQKRVAGNLYNRQIVVKYEIENFKDKAVTLDISENIRALRNEVAGDIGRDVQWELGEGTTLPGKPDKEKSTFEQVVFHVNLPARGADQKAVKTVHKLDVLIKNEW